MNKIEFPDPVKHYQKKTKGIQLKQNIVLDALLSEYDGKRILLDIGTGEFSAFEHPRIRKFGAIALDLSYASLKDNKTYASKIQADARILPIHDNSVDIILSRDCLEHISDVESVFLELERVMKENSILITQIPNFLYYLSFLAYVLPDSIKDFLWRRLRGINKTPYPVYYKINTIWRWRKFARSYNFNIELVEFYNFPSVWFINYPILYWFNELLYIFLSIPLFKIFRSTMLVVAKFNHSS